MYRRTVLWAVVVAVFAGPVVGQAAPADDLPQPLHLDQALERALTSNLAVKQARQQVGIRRGERAHAARIVPTNPELSLNAASRRGDAETTTDLGIRLSQTLFTGGKRDLGIAAAEARMDSARARLAFLQTTIAARTRRAFLDLLVARKAVATAERVLEISRDFQTYARDRLAAGEATRLAANTARIGVGRAEATLAEARTQAERARVRLLELMAADPARELKVAGEIRGRSLDLPDRRALLGQALKRRDDLAAAAREVAAARKALTLSERQLIPNLTVFGFYKREEGADVAGGGVSAPIPALHRYGGEQEAAAARLQQAQLEADALRITVRREVAQALAEYRGARKRLSALKGAVLDSAEQNLALTQDALRAGEVGVPAVTAARDNLLNVRRDYLDALGALVTAATDLERATGGLIALGPQPGKAAGDPTETSDDAN
ncbi:TolC family protein [Thiohalorhabdus sp.]|uniref:TolC family protein n=1 Tax=Thiohalorhabdus sp. TaxID=3094134 RepID=UPI002FC2D224